MIYFYNAHGDFIHKDISLTGGTSATIYGKFDSQKIQSDLSGKLNELDTKEIYDLITGERKALIIETTSDGETTKRVLEEYLGYTLEDKNSSFEFSGSSFTQGFYQQLLWANLIAFILMSLVVLILFRTLIPSFIVIFCVFADILMTLTTVNILGIKMSTAGIIAFLMLIGYSVDTDILLTTRLIKRKEGTINERLFEAFKTGITMTLTSLVAVLAAFFIVRPFSEVLSLMFLILVIGLFFDILNTWLTNGSIIKWYAMKKQHA